MNEHAHGSLHNPEVAHEQSDISIRGVIWFVVILALTSACVDLSMWGVFVILDKVEASNDAYVSPVDVQPGQLPPNPRLQTTPWTDLKSFVGAEENYLNSYGWVDQGAGVVHIPIERAKALLLQRGLPARPAPAGTPVDTTEGTRVAVTGEASGGRDLPAGGPDRSSPIPANVAPTTAPATTTPTAPAPAQSAAGILPAKVEKNKGGGQ